MLAHVILRGLGTGANGGLLLTMGYAVAAGAYTVVVTLATGTDFAGSVADQAVFAGYIGRPPLHGTPYHYTGTATTGDGRTLTGTTSNDGGGDD